MKKEVFFMKLKEKKFLILLSVVIAICMALGTMTAFSQTTDTFDLLVYLGLRPFPDL